MEFSFSYYLFSLISSCFTYEIESYFVIYMKSNINEVQNRINRKEFLFVWKFHRKSDLFLTLNSFCFTLYFLCFKNMSTPYNPNLSNSVPQPAPNATTPSGAPASLNSSTPMSNVEQVAASFPTEDEIRKQSGNADAASVYSSSAYSQPPANPMMQPVYSQSPYPSTQTPLQQPGVAPSPYAPNPYMPPQQYDMYPPQQQQPGIAPSPYAPSPYMPPQQQQPGYPPQQQQPGMYPPNPYMPPQQQQPGYPPQQQPGYPPNAYMPQQHQQVSSKTLTSFIESASLSHLSNLIEYSSRN